MILSPSTLVRWCNSANAAAGKSRSSRADQAPEPNPSSVPKCRDDRPWAKASRCSQLDRSSSHAGATFTGHRLGTRVARRGCTSIAEPASRRIEGLQQFLAQPCPAASRKGNICERIERLRRDAFGVIANRQHGDLGEKKA